MKFHKYLEIFDEIKAVTILQSRWDLSETTIKAYCFPFRWVFRTDIKREADCCWITSRCFTASTTDFFEIPLSLSWYKACRLKEIAISTKLYTFLTTPSKTGRIGCLILLEGIGKTRLIPSGQRSFIRANLAENLHWRFKALYVLVLW